MNKYLKSILIVVPVCMLAAGLTILLYFADPQFNFTVYQVLSMVLVTVWAFFVVPAVLFSVRWVKQYYAKIPPYVPTRMGFYIIRWGWGRFAFVLSLIFSPVTGSLWFVRMIKGSLLSVKEKRNRSEETDPFQL